MKPRTKKNLLAAFAGESQAHMKYAIFADAAKKEGFKNIARLFTAISFAELVHARNHFGALYGENPTTENLQSAIEGETYEVKTMYPGFKAAAKKDKEADAIRSIHFALEAEKTHAKMYADAKRSARAGKDITVSSVYICPVCGHTVFGKAPDTCPVCGVKKSRFRKF
ncbi:MAG: rubrerythrin family protein [Deltaproteobacteria bacterium]